MHNGIKDHNVPRVMEDVYRLVKTIRQYVNTP